MLEWKGDLWHLVGQVNWLCITTNGELNKDGEAIMGRGCALEAKKKWADLPKRFAGLLTQHGNVPMELGVTDGVRLYPPGTQFAGTRIWSFPTKHGWRQQSDIRLIVQSAKLLVYETRGQMLSVAIPRPGCSNGGLSWDFVRPHLQSVLDDRFVIITNTDT